MSANIRPLGGRGTSPEVLVAGLQLEPGLEVQVEAESLARINPAGEVGPDQAIHERDADTRARHRPAGVTPQIARTCPADIAEYDATSRGDSATELQPRHPIRIAALRPRTLTADGLGAAKKKQTLHWSLVGDTRANRE